MLEGEHCGYSIYRAALRAESVCPRVRSHLTGPSPDAVWKERNNSPMVFIASYMPVRPRLCPQLQSSSFS